MKRTLLLLGCCAVLSLPPMASAADFSLRPRDPGPGHRTRTYWWKFNEAFWELIPPEHYTLAGGGEMHLQKVDHPEVTAICRQSSGAERELLTKKDPASQDACFRTSLPAGTKNLKLVSQRDNPLSVNGLSNVEAVYSYELGGVQYLAAYMVSRAVQEPDKKTDPTARPKEDYFTAVVAAPQESQPTLYGAFQQLMATAQIMAKEPAADQSGQYVSHGMLGR